MELRRGANRECETLSEEADGSRQRGSCAATRYTGGRAEGHVQNWGQADVPAGSGSGRGVPPVEADLPKTGLLGLVRTSVNPLSET